VDLAARLAIGGDLGPDQVVARRQDAEIGHRLRQDQALVRLRDRRGGMEQDAAIGGGRNLEGNARVLEPFPLAFEADFDRQPFVL
jgi:hypothetical protein